MTTRAQLSHTQSLPGQGTLGAGSAKAFHYVRCICAEGFSPFAHRCSRDRQFLCWRALRACVIKQMQSLDYQTQTLLLAAAGCFLLVLYCTALYCTMYTKPKAAAPRMLLSADSRRAGQGLVRLAEPACSGLSGSAAGSDSGLFSLGPWGSSTYCIRASASALPTFCRTPPPSRSVPRPARPPPSELSPALQASTLTKPVGPALASWTI